VIGSGPLVSKIKAEVLSGTIIYLGNLSHQDTLKMISNAKTVFNTSYIEGVSVVSLEALALGASLLSFNVGGMSELLWHPHMHIWNDDYDIVGFTNVLSQINKNQVKLSDIDIPITYTQEFHKQEWRKLIELALLTLN
jgi:glycosyltransferase involved in cell wall biosynthesis